MIGPVKIISGSAHPELAQDICKYLEIELCRSSVVRFSNENMLAQIEENVREADAFEHARAPRSGRRRATSPYRTSSSRSRSMARSARAVMVSAGFRAAVEPGINAPSTTKRLRLCRTRPKVSQTRPITAPPRG